MERFLDAIHKENSEISRSEKNYGIKLVDGSELSSDALDYFINEKTSLENEFYSDLVKEIGKEKANWFCAVISEDWYDGRGARNGPRVTDLKCSIRNLLIEIIKAEVPLNSIVVLDKLPSAEAMLSILDIIKILRINKEMLIRHIEE